MSEEDIRNCISGLVASALEGFYIKTTLATIATAKELQLDEIGIINLLEDTAKHSDDIINDYVTEVLGHLELSINAHESMSEMRH